MESFAPKMEAAKITELKKKFLLDYTIEILTAAIMRSTRLLSQAAHQAARKDFRWIAWKHRMIQEKVEEIMVQRPSKQARLEALSWSSILLDDLPTLEVGNANVGIHTIRNILAVHDTALALVGTARLARLKGYPCKFMQLLTQRYDAESGLRSPSVLEAQHADSCGKASTPL